MRQRFFDFEDGIDLREIRDRLLKIFGPQHDDERFDPLSQLVYGVIASRTRDDVSMKAFLRLRACCPSWGELIETPTDVIEYAIQTVTFAEKKAVDLPIMLLMLEKRHGLDLDFLADLEEETAMRYLMALHAVGPKIAATVLNFSNLRKRVLAVDTHLLRVGERLGIVPPGSDDCAGHDHYAAVLPEEWDADTLYEFHWLIKKLGQTTCPSGLPNCAACPLHDLCPSRDLHPAVA
jgi:endonuclease-3